MALPRFCLIACLVMIMCPNTDAVAPTAADYQLRDAWADRIASSPPVSLQYGGRPLAALLSTWSLQSGTSDGGKDELIWRDPASGLQLKITATRFPDFPAIEWIGHLKNTGTTDTKLIQDIQALESDFVLETSAPIQAHYANGGVASFDDFAPRVAELKPGAPLQLRTADGRSSSEFLPFFNLHGGDSGVILAIGWSGGWAARFENEEPGTVRVRAGFSSTSLVLYPGEEIRTPRMLALFYKGDTLRGQNLLRRFILAHHRPLRNGEPLIAPITNGNWGATSATVHMDNIRNIIEQKLPIEYYWIDAGWYGDPNATDVGSWATNVGNWTIKPNIYPHGFKDIGRMLRATDRELMLWFEPERVHAGTPWHKEHPEWLLSVGDQNLLMDLGNPDARKFVTDSIWSRIADFGLGCYRQDFNMNPAPYWAKADAPQRRGMTEIRHIEGLYAFWDALLKSYPLLIIDNCASGGRRIDLETIGRATPFWRTDGPRDPIAHQCHTYGLLSWIPLSATSQDRAGDDYEFRSSMCSALCINWEHSGDGPQKPYRHNLPYDWARKTLEQYLSIRDYYYGDYYPLTTYSTATSTWMAYQLDRPEQGDGIIVALRRPDSRDESLHLQLHALNADANYVITDLDSGRTDKHTGSELLGVRASSPHVPPTAKASDLGLTVTILSRPGSALLKYVIQRRAKN